MKKKVIIVLIILLLVVGISSFFVYKYYKDKKEQEKYDEAYKNAKVEIELVEDLSMNFKEKKKVSDFISSINGKIVDDYYIKPKKLGNNKIKYEYINDEGYKLKEEYTIKITDDTSPLVFLSGSYSVAVNSDPSFVENIFCADDFDDNPTCEIEGNYDLTTPDTYYVKFKATDSSGNITEVPFNLRVYEPNPNSSTKTNNQTYTKTYYSDVVKNYKTNNTKIGLDVSEWQGEIDFEKIKDAGVEFMFIRVGGTKGTEGEYFVDKQFERNIKLANENNIPVGIYFYSYAGSSKEAKENAKWVVDHIKKYKVDLPVVFDWEDFGDYNSYHMSFYSLTNMADDFLKIVEDAGYTGMMYGSKTYLEKIWLDYPYDTWLAHYTDHTSYSGDYKVWQMCNDGIIDGINGSVDINIMYE